MQKSVLIALEGGEGSGKDTMIDRLKKKYAGRDDLVFTREPGGTEVGEKIRKLVLSPETKGMDPLTELLLFVAARAQLMREIVIPALNAGKSVISNRFGLSTVAYQIYGRQRYEYENFLRQLSEQVMGDYKPNYILLDVTPEIGLARVESRGDEKNRFDAETLEFHRRVRSGYLSEGSTILNANQPLEMVWSEVERQVAYLLGETIPS